MYLTLKVKILIQFKAILIETYVRQRFQQCPTCILHARAYVYWTKGPPVGPNECPHAIHGKQAYV